MDTSLLSCLVVAFSLTVFAQTPVSPVPTDSLELLRQVGQHYADAKSYHIEAVEESTFFNELQRSWNKSVIEAAQAPGDRYHYEGHGGAGGTLRIADGKNVWTYHINAGLYTKTPVPTGKSNSGSFGSSEMAMFAAENLRRGLAEIGKHYKSAFRLPDAAVEIDGRRVTCYVVRVQTEDMKRTPRLHLRKNHLDRQCN